MNYKKHYYNLINKRRKYIPTGYTEKHHILPKCLGGTDESKNIVRLTAREHFIAHLLLFKIYPDSFSLIKAINMMCCFSDTHKKRSFNRMYSWLKESFSKSMSFSQSGTKNSQYNTRWVSNITLKKSKKIPKNDTLEEGWQEGRIIDFDLYEKRLLSEKEKIERQEKRKREKQEKIKRERLVKERNRIKKQQQFILDVKKSFLQFVNGNYESMSDYARQIGVNKMTLSKRWKTHVPEYITEHGKRFKGVSDSSNSKGL